MAMPSAEIALNGLSSVTGEFSDRETERRFSADQHGCTLRQARFLFALGAGASVILFLANLLLFERTQAAGAVAPRTIALAVSAAAWMLAPRLKPGHLDALIAVWQIAIALTSAALLEIQQNIAAAPVLLVPAVFYLAAPTRFVTTATMGVAASAILFATYVDSLPLGLQEIRLAAALVVMNGLLCIVRSRAGRQLRTQWATTRSYQEALAGLGDSQMMLERTFMAVPTPLVVSDIEMGTITRANSAAERFLKLPPGALQGRRISEFYDNPQDRTRLSTMVREYGHIRKFPVNVRNSEGELRSILVSASKVAESGGQSCSVVASVQDITEQEQQEQKLRAAEKEYRTLFERAAVGIYRTSPDGRLLRANPAFVRLNGYATEIDFVAAVTNRAADWYVEPGRRNEWLRLMSEKGRVADFVSEVYRHKTRERIWISESSWTVMGANGEVVCYEGTVIEATDRKRLEVEADHLARHDHLTNLANRRMFMERLESASARVKRYGGYFALLYLDLDRFKPVNDQLGHAAGDAVLGEAARRLKSACRAGDTVARMGGDEFAVLSVGIGDPSRLDVLAERILEAFRKPFTVEGSAVQIGTSIGIAVAPNDGLDPKGLLAKADQALYKAKTSGRAQYRFHNDEIGVQRDTEGARPRRRSGGIAR